MKLEELRETISDKLPMTDEEWNQTIQQGRDELKEFGVREEDIEKKLPAKILSMLHKRLYDGTKKYELITIGEGAPSDFGAKKLYDDIKQRWENSDENIRNVMVQSGEIDSEGNPLWSDDNTKMKFKYQDREGNMKDSKDRRINPDWEYQKKIIAITKGNDNGLYFAEITLRGDMAKTEVPIGYDGVEANLSGNYDETRNVFFLRATKNTKFQKRDDYKELSGDEIKQAIQSAGGTVVSSQENEDMADFLNERYVFVSDLVVTNSNKTEGDKSNFLKVIPPTPTALSDESKSIQCFLGCDSPVPPEGDIGVDIFGKLNYRNERYEMNVFNLWFDGKGESVGTITPEAESEENETKEW